MLVGRSEGLKRRSGRVAGVERERGRRGVEVVEAGRRGMEPPKSQDFSRLCLVADQMVYGMGSSLFELCLAVNQAREGNILFLSLKRE